MATPLPPDEAERLKQAIDADDAEGAAALGAAARVALHEGRFEDALALARAVAVADPDAARAWVLVARAAEGLGRLEDARRALETAVSLDDKDLETAVHAAELQAKTGAPGAARALATYVVLHERGAPELAARAQAVIDALEARP